LPAVGNDIVDLNAPGNAGKSRDSRFLDRVFTEGERQRIAGASSPDRLLWMLWAAKEAAYKALSRGSLAVCSIPRRYPVFLDDAEPVAEGMPCTGRVATPKGELALVVVATAQWVHALAAEARPDRLCHGVALVAGDEDPSSSGRSHFLQTVAGLTGCPAEVLAIASNPDGTGAPRLLFSGRPLDAPFSLSHDGRFTAFACDPAILRSAIRAANGCPGKP
jgi:hypothetical protein